MPSHIASQWQSQDANPGSPGTEIAPLLTAVTVCPLLIGLWLLNCGLNFSSPIDD